MNAPTKRRPPRVLIPFDVKEAITVAEAAEIAGCTKVTVRNWAAEYDLGRRIGGTWRLSRVALAMYLDADKIALQAYLEGDRESEDVVAYFQRFGIEIQQKNSTKNISEAKDANPDMVSAEI